MKKKIKFIILFLVVFAQNTISYAQYLPNSWSPENTTGIVSRRWSTSFSIGTSIYMGTGYTGSSTWLADFGEFSKLTNSWTAKAPFPGAARSDAISFSIGGYGYIGLGGTQLNNYTDMYRYDPSGDTWTAAGAISSLPATAGCADAVSFVIDGKGYVCLGSNGTTSLTFHNDLYEYDPSMNTWTLKASFPGAARSNAVCFVIDNIAYVGTGVDGTTSYNDFYSYNASSDTWSSSGSIPALPGGGRSAGVGFSLCGYGYAGAGINGTTSLSDLYQYDPVHNSWSVMNSYTGSDTYGLIAASVNIVGDTALAYVGFGEEGGAPAQFYKYSPPVQCIPITNGVNNIKSVSDLEISPNPATTTFTIASSGKIYTVEVCNLLGQTVYTNKYADETVNIDVAGLPTGVYIVKVNGSEVRKITKQ